MILWDMEQITGFHVHPSLLLQHNSNIVETAVRPNYLINYSDYIALQFTECVWSMVTCLRKQMSLSTVKDACCDMQMLQRNSQL